MMLLCQCILLLPILVAAVEEVMAPERKQRHQYCNWIGQGDATFYRCANDNYPLALDGCVTYASLSVWGIFPFKASFMPSTCSTQPRGAT